MLHFARTRGGRGAVCSGGQERRSDEGEGRRVAAGEGGKHGQLLRLLRSAERMTVGSETESETSVLK